MNLDDLKPAPYNPRRISPAALKGLSKSLETFGDISGLTWNSRSGALVSGHQRLAALRGQYGEGLSLDGDDVEGWAVVDWDEATEKAANNGAIAGEFTDDVDALLAEIKAADEALFSELRLDELMKPGPIEDLSKDRSGGLRRLFGVPPFSVLDTRQGYWKERRAGWLARGITSEEGREDGLLFKDGTYPPRYYVSRNAMRAATGRDPSWPEVVTEMERRGLPPCHMTSIFDPVLVELAVRWFCPPGGLVLDPFAGGSVRGVVSSILGRRYHGIDLRPEQIEANERQADVIIEAGIDRPVWVVGDSRTAPLPAQVDLLFSCPPYADLEKYSDDPNDLSNMTFDDFLMAYREIIRRSVEALQDNRFVVWVVGDIRDKRGVLRDFVSLTISAFHDVGAKLYNEAIIVNMAGSLPVRAPRAFKTTRKLGKQHQQFLVFVKGDAKKATEAVGDVDFGSGEESPEE